MNIRVWSVVALVAMTGCAKRVSATPEGRLCDAAEMSDWNAAGTEAALFVHNGHASFSKGDIVKLTSWLGELPCVSSATAPDAVRMSLPTSTTIDVAFRQPTGSAVHQYLIVRIGHLKTLTTPEDTDVLEVDGFTAQR